MGAVKDLFMDTVYDGCDALFEWNEYGCRSLSEIYDEYYPFAMTRNEPYNTPSNLADSLMIEGALFADPLEKQDIREKIYDAMRSMLEYASDTSPRDMCYSTDELLDRFNKLVEFNSLMD